MKFNFKKISAVCVGTIMAFAGVGFAAAANYPVPFVQNGAADVAIVFGAEAASLDVVDASAISTNLQSKLTGTSEGTDTTVIGEAESLDTSATRIWLNTSLNTAKSVFTKTDLPIVLQDYTFSGNVDSKLTSTIKFAAGAAAGTDNSGKVIFAKQPTSSEDPQFGISLGATQASYPLYNASITMPVIAFNHTDSEGETIKLFGRDFVVSTATDATSLVLFSSAQEVTLTAGGDNPNPSTKVTISGTEYTVELVTGTSTTATIAVNGESKEINEGSSKKISGIDIAIKSVTESTAVNTIVASVLIGSEKLTFTAGSQVLKGSDDNPIDGTSVHFSGTSNALTGLTVVVFSPDSSSDAILPGQTFVDPVFGSFKTEFVGMNSGMNDTNRETITVKNSGDDTMVLSLTDYDGNAGLVEFAHNLSTQWFLGDDNNKSIKVIEMDNFTENDYVVVGNEDYGHILKVTDIYNQTSGSTSITGDRVKFQDVMSKDTYSTTFSTTEGSGTLTVDGKEYAVTFSGSDEISGWAHIKYPTGDSATDSTFVIYPTIKTKSGALVTLYEPKILNMSNMNDSSTRIATFTLNFPDGDGYTGVTATYGGSLAAGNNTWTIGSTVINTTRGSDAVDYSTTNTIGTLAFNISASNVANRTTVYLQDPETPGNRIDQPALIIWEGKDDLNNYHAVVVDLEKDPAGSSTDGVGVSDVFFSSDYGHYSASKASDTDLTQDVDWWGTLTTLNADDSDQKYLTISYPASQIYSQIYLGENTAVITGGSDSSGGTSGTQLGNVLVKDNEVSNVATKNLIVVGGSCINTAAAALVGGSFCEADFTTATKIGSGEFILKGYANSTITSKVALLVAGYDQADTHNAVTYLTTHTDVDTTKGYKGTSATVATLIVE